MSGRAAGGRSAAQLLRRSSCWLGAAALAAACAEARPEPVAPLGRSGRFGSLRDFVLFERTVAGRDASFFLDRFETTRGDWAEFAASAAGAAVGAAAVPTSGDPALPAAGHDLAQARAFAQWRFARLPRLDEWQFAAVGDGRYAFPWGSKVDAARANTAELGLGEPTLVGTFESGRRAEGDLPYDLVGNVSEWTETVPLEWFLAGGHAAPLAAAGPDPLGSMAQALRRARRDPGLALWAGPGGLLPLAAAVAAGGPYVPRQVVGADFLTPMAQATEVVFAGDRRARTGCRLAAAPAELLAALLAYPAPLLPAEQEQVRRFVARDRHRAVLAAAWPAARAAAGAAPAAPLARLLQVELGRAAAAEAGR